jgi:hypothetical protein
MIIYNHTTYLLFSFLEEEKKRNESFEMSTNRNKCNYSMTFIFFFKSLLITKNKIIDTLEMILTTFFIFEYS